ncbi:hypothetical protein RMATCC62417_13886 [Rhizopus microsporus]|nr:hypothetical protein RMATCC62417_13886 [Rhizopus microsporus]
MTTATISLTKFKECLNQWAKLNDKGEQCLSQQVLGQSSTDLDAIVEEFKQVLETMFEEYAFAVNALGLEQAIERDDTTKIPENINLMRYCVDMYDQEFMVKECIRGIVSTEGFATQQHLAGSIALWKAESYLDDEIQQRIKNF